MIEGLHFDVSSEELTKVLAERIEQSRKKAEMYEKQAKQQEAMTDELGKEEVDLPKFSNDASTNLRSKAREYTQKVKEYSFLLDHVIRGEIYRLDRDSLVFLGILQRGY